MFIHKPWHDPAIPVYGDAVTIEIRRLSRDDADAYRQIRLASLAKAPEAFGSDHHLEVDLPLEHFAQRLESCVAFGAWARGPTGGATGDAIVGTMNYQRGARAKERHKALVAGVFVEPDWRGHGVAARLLTALIEHAQVELEQLILTVVGGNEAAIALYRRFGFEAYGVEPRARKTPHGYTDQVLMILLLPKGSETVAAP